MDIYLETKNLIDDIGARFLMETGSPDPIPARGIVVQSLNEADAKLRNICGRYLAPVVDICAGDELTKADAFMYNLILSPRKASGKVQAFADTMHSYMVNAALAKIFSSMNADLAKKHDEQTVSDAMVLDNLFHSKIPPTW